MISTNLPYHPNHTYSEFDPYLPAHIDLPDPANYIPRDGNLTGPDDHPISKRKIYSLGSLASNLVRNGLSMLRSLVVGGGQKEKVSDLFKSDHEAKAFVFKNNQAKKDYILSTEEEILNYLFKTNEEELAYKSKTNEEKLAYMSRDNEKIVNSMFKDTTEDTAQYFARLEQEKWYQELAEVFRVPSQKRI